MDAYTEWMSTPIPQFDAVAEGHAAAAFALIELDPTERRLRQAIVGDMFVDMLSRVVRSDQAEREAAELRRDNRLVAVEHLRIDDAGRQRARITVTLRRPNLHQLCKANLLNRRSVNARLEGWARDAVLRGRTFEIQRNDGAALGVPRTAVVMSGDSPLIEQDRWRLLFRRLLMYGGASKKPAEDAGQGAIPHASECPERPSSAGPLP